MEWIRRDGKAWTAEVLEASNDRLAFEKHGIELTLAEIYDGIDLD